MDLGHSHADIIIYTEIRRVIKMGTDMRMHK